MLVARTNLIDKTLHLDLVDGIKYKIKELEVGSRVVGILVGSNSRYVVGVDKS